MRDPDCGDGPPQPAPCVPDTLNIPDVGTAYLKYTCKDAAKYLRCSRRSWGWDMAEPTCTQSYTTHVVRGQIRARTPVKYSWGCQKVPIFWLKTTSDRQFSGLQRHIGPF